MKVLDFITFILWPVPTGLWCQYVEEKSGTIWCGYFYKVGKGW